MTTEPLLEDCTGALVAGGRGTRLGGIVKGLLVSAGEPIAARSLALFGSLFADVVVIANDPAPWRELGVRVEPDRFGGKGAPAGVHAALDAARTPWVFTAAADMPFLSARAIRFLAAHRVEGDLAVVPTWRGIAQPLHAFWSRRSLEPIAALVSGGDPSLQGIVRAIGARLVPEADWAGMDPDGRSFENANTPEDLARLGIVAPPPPPR